MIGCYLARVATPMLGGGLAALGAPPLPAKRKCVACIGYCLCPPGKHLPAKNHCRDIPNSLSIVLRSFYAATRREIGKIGGIQ